MALPCPDDIRRPRGNPGFQSPAVHIEEDLVEAGSLMRDMVALECEERYAQRHLRDAESSSARLRSTNRGVEAEAQRHLAALVDGLRDLLAMLPSPSPERTACWRLMRDAQQVVELEARARDLRHRIEERESEAAQHRERLDLLTGQEIALGRAAVEQLRSVGRQIVSIDARGASVRARYINIGGAGL